MTKKVAVNIPEEFRNPVYFSGLMSHEHWMLDRAKEALLAGSKTVRLHPVKTNWTPSGKARGVTYELYNKLVGTLEKWGIPYTEGNDAPRGGAKGDFIEFRVDRRRATWKRLAKWL